MTSGLGAPKNLRQAFVAVNYPQQVG